MKKSFLIAALSIVSTGLFAQQATGKKAKMKASAVKTTTPIKLKQKIAKQTLNDPTVKQGQTVTKKQVLHQKKRQSAKLKDKRSTTK